MTQDSGMADGRTGIIYLNPLEQNLDVISLKVEVPFLSVEHTIDIVGNPTETLEEAIKYASSLGYGIGINREIRSRRPNAAIYLVALDERSRQDPHLYRLAQITLENGNHWVIERAPNQERLEHLLITKSFIIR